MKQLFTLFFALYLASASGQVTWFQPNDTWVFSHYTYPFGDLSAEKLTTDGTQVVNNVSYVRLKREIVFSSGTSAYHRLVRQDGYKVYTRHDSTFPEYILYDFNLEIGDTLKHAEAWGILEYVVRHIDTVSIGGVDRKRQVVDILNAYHFSSTEAIFVEGIGSVVGTFPNSGVLELGSSYFFIDEYPTDQLDTYTPFFCRFFSDWGSYYAEVSLSLNCAVIDTKEPAATAINIAPNPSNGIFTVQTTDNAPYAATLFDIQGRQLLQIDHAQGEQTIQTAFKGIGVLRIVLANGDVAVRKVVFE